MIGDIFLLGLGVVVFLVLMFSVFDESAEDDQKELARETAYLEGLVALSPEQRSSIYTKVVVKDTKTPSDVRILEKIVAIDTAKEVVAHE